MTGPFLSHLLTCVSRWSSLGRADAIVARWGGACMGWWRGRTPHVVGDGKCRRISVGKISKSQTRPKSCRAEVLKMALHGSGAGRPDQPNLQALPGPERTRKACTPLYYYFIPLWSKACISNKTINCYRRRRAPPDNSDGGSEATP